VTFESNAGLQVPMQFGVGSELEVFVKTYEGSCSTRPMSMHDADAARVLLDQCNTTGT
jgi:hypothetical protein